MYLYIMFIQINFLKIFNSLVDIIGSTILSRTRNLRCIYAKNNIHINVQVIKQILNTMSRRQVN